MLVVTFPCKAPMLEVMLVRGADLYCLPLVPAPQVGHWTLRVATLWHFQDLVV